MQSLAQAIEIGSFRFRNRMVMAPMCAMYAAPDGSVTPRMVEYYRARARGGAAMVIAEITFTDNGGSRAFHAQLGAHDDRMIPGLSDLAEAIRGEGAIAGLQLGHCGPQRVISEPPVVSASPIPWAPGKRTPLELSQDEIEQIIEDHGEAARRVRQAGFDLVELHGAHGYLINAFLSPATNFRADGWGGSADNRLRFPLALVRTVREQIGRDCLLSVRLNGDDMLAGGLGIDEYAKIARILADEGVDLLHVSAGTYRAMERRITPMYLDGVDFSEYAAPIRKASGLGVIASGSIHDLALANRLVESNQADFVSFARPLFADPDLPAKVEADRVDLIRPCIRCNTCVSREQGGARGLCAVNPQTGTEVDRIPAPLRGKDVAIVGAGPAGIQAALSASARGHRVRLFERSEAVGGLLGMAAGLPFKKPLVRLIAYWRAELARCKVEVSLGREIDMEAIDAEAIIEATGACWPTPVNPNGQCIVDPVSVLRDPGALGERVAVVGAATIGAELAWYLASRGRQVTLVERRPSFGVDVNLISSLVLPEALARHGVDVRFGTEYVGVNDGLVQLTHQADSITIPTDCVVMCVRGPVPPIRSAGFDSGQPRIRVGEWAGLPGLLNATRSGHAAANRI